MRITILGAGAMGGLFGAYLSRQNEVTLIGRNPELVAAVNQNGMVIRERDGSSAVYRPRAALSARGLPPADLAVVFVKAMQSESALLANRDMIGPDTYLMTLQNGSGHEDTLLKFADKSRVALGTTQQGAVVESHGVVTHFGNGDTYFGAISGDSERLRPFAEAFTACGLRAEVSADVQHMIWKKLFTNSSVSALTAALQQPMGFIVKDSHAWELCRHLLEEALDVAAGIGLEFDRKEIISGVKAVCENAPEGLPSIYSDIKNGRKTEVDTISGSVVRAGLKCGVATPNHSFLVEFIHALEAKAGKRS